VSISSGTTTLNWTLRRDWAASAGGATVAFFTNPPDYTPFGCGPAGLIDQSQASGWGSDAPTNPEPPAQNPQPKQIVIRMPTMVDISELTINPSNTCGDAGSASTGDYVLETSPDGVTWTRGADMPAAFGDRGAVAATVSTDGSTLYLIGGEMTGSGGAGDVWSTTDGVTWTQRNAAAPFGTRGRASALYFNNRLWLLGGDLSDSGGEFYQDDAWWSADGGVTWTQATAAAGALRFTPRAGQTAAVYDNRMWVLGGQHYGEGTVYDLDDAYYSFDGVNWIQAASGEAFHRNGAGTVVFGGRLVTMFGENTSMKNDVWSTT